MPLYEYLCGACHERTEVLQRFGEAPRAICPRCGGALKKLLSAPAFQFKGSGWYVSDYARKAAGGDSESKPAGGDSESKPAEKSPATSAGETTSSAASAKSEAAPASATSDAKPSPSKAGD